MSRLAGTLKGPSRAPLRAVDHALAARLTAEDRKPRDTDRPPTSTFPMTKAAREALRLRRKQQANAG